MCALFAIVPQPITAIFIFAIKFVTSDSLCLRIICKKQIGEFFPIRILPHSVLHCKRFSQKNKKTLDKCQRIRYTIVNQKHGSGTSFRISYSESRRLVRGGKVSECELATELSFERVRQGLVQVSRSERVSHRHQENRLLDRSY